MMKFLAQAWAAIKVASGPTYAALALADAVSEFNEYVRYNLKRWQNFQFPSCSYPASVTTCTATLVQSLTGGAGQAQISNVVTDASAYGWGLAIFRDTAAITVLDWSKCVDIVYRTGAGTIVTVDSPLKAGTYHYRSVCFDINGNMGVACADGSCVVTAN